MVEDKPAGAVRSLLFNASAYSNISGPVQPMEEVAAAEASPVLPSGSGSGSGGLNKALGHSAGTSSSSSDRIFLIAVVALVATVVVRQWPAAAPPLLPTPGGGGGALKVYAHPPETDCMLAALRGRWQRIGEYGCAPPPAASHVLLAYQR